MGEIWRDVPSVPGILVSSEGRIMYAPHREPMPHGGERCYGGQPTFGIWHKQNARFEIPIRAKGGKRKKRIVTTYKIARLIAEAFHGPPPFDGAVVMHLDENAANNRPENLKWGTRKQNCNAEGYLAYCRGRIGENNPRIKSRRQKEIDGNRTDVVVDPLTPPLEIEKAAG
jgi:hypothetical protein